jgi:hypothetical protein
VKSAESEECRGQDSECREHTADNSGQRVQSTGHTRESRANETDSTQGTDSIQHRTEHTGPRAEHTQHSGVCRECRLESRGQRAQGREFRHESFIRTGSAESTGQHRAESPEYRAASTQHSAESPGWIAQATATISVIVKRGSSSARDSERHSRSPQCELVPVPGSLSVCRGHCRSGS